MPGIKLDARTRFPCSGSLVDLQPDGAMLVLKKTQMDAKAKEALKPVLAEFREGIAHHRAEGATEERINQILAASVRLAVQQVDDPELCAWLCEEFSNAARVEPIVTNHPASPTLH